MSRLFFRGIYFPQKGAWQWLKLIAQNRSSVWRIVKDSFTQWNGTSDRRQVRDFEHGVQNATLVAQSEPRGGSGLSPQKVLYGVAPVLVSTTSRWS